MTAKGKPYNRQKYQVLYERHCRIIEDHSEGYERMMLRVLQIVTCAFPEVLAKQTSSEI
jgi:hypothetical protein